MECYHQSRRYLIKLESGLMIRRKQCIFVRDILILRTTLIPLNQVDDGDVKNNEPNYDSDGEVGNNFNRAVIETESSCHEPRRSNRKHWRTRRFDDYYVME